MTGYPLSKIQQAYNVIREEAGEALDPVYCAGLLRALEILREMDENADPGAETDWPEQASLGG